MATLKLVLKYLCHSLAFVFFLACFTALRILSSVANPTVRGFYCNDETILYPSTKQETVPTWALVIYIVSLPLAVVSAALLYREMFYFKRYRLSSQ